MNLTQLFFLRRNSKAVALTNPGSYGNWLADKMRVNFKFLKKIVVDQILNFLLIRAI